MANVNSKIREAVRIELARLDKNQAQLAQEVGVSRQYMSDIMRAKAGNVPAVWQKVLDALGLEIVAKSKSQP